jgi:hypothetical protein
MSSCQTSTFKVYPSPPFPKHELPFIPSDGEQHVHYSHTSSSDDIYDAHSLTLPSIRDLFPDLLTPSAAPAFRPAKFYNKTLENVNHHTVKPRRKRVGPEQLKKLTDMLNMTQFPTYEQRHQLAKELRMTPRSVQIWFQNKRQNMKLMNQV